MKLSVLVIARAQPEAIQSIVTEPWIASEYLAMTERTVTLRKVSY